MKNPILRILINAVLLSLISGIVVSIIGITLKWKTPTQFSDGFFWAGAIIISIGFLNVLGMLSQPNDPRLQHSQSAVHLDTAERFKIWDGDLLHGRKLLAFLGTSGLLLFGMAKLALLVGGLF